MGGPVQSLDRGSFDGYLDIAGSGYCLITNAPTISQAMSTDARAHAT